MKKVYIGGPLFTEAEVSQRLKEGTQLEELGYDVYNPIANDDINDKNDNPTARDIFTQDVSEILTSDIVTAPIDNEDPGLMMELGLVLGGNLFMRAFEYMKKELDDESIRVIEKYTPFRSIEILSIASDIRKETAGNYEGVRVPKGYNQFVIGGLDCMCRGRVYDSFAKIKDILAKRMEDTSE